MRGRVQGVGFRVSLARVAESRGVAGSVRNQSDGTVEAVLEGPSEAVDAVLRWCEHGPRGAVVEGVSVEAAQAAGLDGLEIR